MHDEELASGGVGRHGARHGEHAAVMLEVILEAVAGELTLDAVAGAADAGALGVAPLNHEAGYDAVEYDAVIKALADKRDEIIDRVGRDFGVKLRLHHVAVFHFDGYDRIAHW